MGCSLPSLWQWLMHATFPLQADKGVQRSLEDPGLHIYPAAVMQTLRFHRSYHPAEKSQEVVIRWPVPLTVVSCTIKVSQLTSPLSGRLGL